MTSPSTSIPGTSNRSPFDAMRASGAETPQNTTDVPVLTPDEDRALGSFATKNVSRPHDKKPKDAAPAPSGPPDPFAVADADNAPGAGADGGSTETVTSISRTLGVNSTLTTWSSGTTQRALAGGVTVDHSDSTAGNALGNSDDGNGRTVVTLGDKTRIETDGAASDGGAAGNNSAAMQNLQGAGGTGITPGKAHGALITLADGTRIRATAKGVEITRPGSKTPETVKTGTPVQVGDYQVSVQPDGASTISAKDGTKVVTDTGGKSTTTLGGANGPEIGADGSVTTTAEDHSRETLGPDGSLVTTSTYSTTEDGASTLISDDGSARRTLPNDTVIETDPNNGNRVKTTLHGGIVIDTVDAADSSAPPPDPAAGKDAPAPASTAPTRATTVTLSDGTIVKFGPLGVSMTNSKGVTTSVVAGGGAKPIPGPDGATISMSGAGVATLHFADGKNVVVNTDGDPRTTVPQAGSTTDSVGIEGDGSTMITKGDSATVYDAQGNAIGSAKVKVEGGNTILSFNTGLVTSTSKTPEGGDIVISKNSDEGSADVRLPSGAEILMGSSDLSALLPNGSRLSTTDVGFSYTTSSGTVVPIVRGAPPKKLSDGTTVEFTRDGELNIVMMPDKTKLHVDENKVITTTLADGRIVNVDGTVTVMAADGSRTTTDLDGTAVDKSTIGAADGNGVTTETYANSKRRTYRSATVKIDHDPDAGLATTQLIDKGVTVRTSNNPSSVSTTWADGSKIMFDGTNWVSISSTGIQTPIAKDDPAVTVNGITYDLGTDGTMEIKFPDGTSIKTSKEGITTIDNGKAAKSGGFTVSNDGTYTAKA